MNSSYDILYVESMTCILYCFSWIFCLELTTWQWFETQITAGKHDIISMSGSGNYVLITKLLNHAIP
jgi:hypothetical protein